MVKDDTTIAELMHEVLSCYMNLHGIHHVKAEIMYIKEIQMMDGYGMEYYAAKVHHLHLFLDMHFMSAESVCASICTYLS